MRAPMVKATHGVVRTRDGVIRLGGHVYGVAGEIEDTDGVVWSLLTGMDGTRSPDEVAAWAERRHPEVEPAVLRDAVDQLIATGYVEEADPSASTLAGDQRERYSRSAAYYGFVDRSARRSPWDAQERLGAARTAVVGVGGTGCAAAWALAAGGVGSLVLVDDDHVALSNLNRQLLFGDADLDRAKVDAAGRRLADLRADLALDLVPQRMRSAEDLAAVMDRVDVLLLCADQPPDIAEWADAAAAVTATPWVQGGYAGPHVTTTLYVAGTGTCHACAQAGHPDPLSGAVELAHPAEAFAPVTGTTAGISGLLMAHVAIAHLTGAAPPEPGLTHVWNMARLGHAYEVRATPRADCPTCSVRP